MNFTFANEIIHISFCLPRFLKDWRFQDVWDDTEIEWHQTIIVLKKTMFEQNKRTRLYVTHLSKAVKFEGLSIVFHPFRVCCRSYSWATASLAWNFLESDYWMLAHSKTSRKWFWKKVPGGPGRFRRGSENGIKNILSNHLGTPRNRTMMSAIIHVFIRGIDRSGISCRMRPTRKRGLSIMVGKSGEP